MENHSVRAFNSRLHLQEFNSALGKWKMLIKWMEKCAEWEIANFSHFFVANSCHSTTMQTLKNSIRSADALIFLGFSEFFDFGALFCGCVCAFVKLIERYQYNLRNGREEHFFFEQNISNSLDDQMCKRVYWKFPEFVKFWLKNCWIKYFT